jgi:phosphotransferase system IIA component
VQLTQMLLITAPVAFGQAITLEQVPATVFKYKLVGQSQVLVLAFQTKLGLQSQAPGVTVTVPRE